MSCLMSCVLLIPLPWTQMAINCLCLWPVKLFVLLSRLANYVILQPLTLLTSHSLSLPQPADLLLRGPGATDGAPGAPETSFIFWTWGGGRRQGAGSGRWTLHPQPGPEDGPVQPPLTAHQQAGRGGRNTGGHPAAQGQRPLPDTTHHPGRGGAGTERFKETATTTVKTGNKNRVMVQ